SAILSRMLLTICPNCTAQFKVQPEQLNVRQGRVMCGRCRNVFNAFQSLSRLEETDEARPNIPQPATTPLSSTALQDALPARASEQGLVDDHLFLRAEPLPPAAVFSASKPFPSPAEAALPPDTTYVHEERHAQNAQSEDGGSQKFSLLDLEPVVKPSAQLAIDISSANNPLLVEMAPTKPQPTKTSTLGWVAGAFVLLLGLVAQLSFMFRTPLAISYPELRPALGQMCEIAKCTIPWGRDGAQFEIIGSELIEAPGKPGRILLTATLINRAKIKQDLPSLDLKLTDNANRVVVGRALHPRDYLGRAIEKDEGLAPNAELYVSLTLDISGKQLASGYGLLPFYP
ncbi:MAG: zinc-ribbon and DUF3426 domain-containing protein, partial [Betaproteobacteria bacterium]